MDEKFILKSKTIIGAILLLFKGFGVDLPFADEELSQAVDNVIGIVGFVLVVWGRLSADKPLGFKLK